MVNLTDMSVTIKKPKLLRDLTCHALARECAPGPPLLIFGRVPKQFEHVGAASDPADCR